MAERTIVRVKRQRDEAPVEAFVLEMPCSKRRHVPLQGRLAALSLGQRGGLAQALEEGQAQAQGQAVQVERVRFERVGSMGSMRGPDDAAAAFGERLAALRSSSAAAAAAAAGAGAGTGRPPAASALSAVPPRIVRSRRVAEQLESSRQARSAVIDACRVLEGSGAVKHVVDLSLGGSAPAPAPHKPQLVCNGVALVGEPPAAAAGEKSKGEGEDEGEEEEEVYDVYYATKQVRLGDEAAETQASQVLRLESFNSSLLWDSNEAEYDPADSDSDDSDDSNAENNPYNSYPEDEDEDDDAADEDDDDDDEDEYDDGRMRLFPRQTRKEDEYYHSLDEESQESDDDAQMIN
eukprot:m51a1_g9878 hypothetical protein (349) ;mRNA; f:3279-4555